MCDVSFMSVMMQQEGQLFRIEVDMFLLCRSVGVDVSFTFTPVLSDAGHRLELPWIMVVGARRYYALRCAVKGLFGRPIFQGYKVRKIFKAVNSRRINYSYRVCLDYEEWMAGAEISLLQS